MPETHPIRQRCPSTFPPCFDTPDTVNESRWREWDEPTPTPKKPRYNTRLTRVLSCINPWIDRNSEIETSSPTATPPWHETAVRTHNSKLPNKDATADHLKLIAKLSESPHSHLIAYTDGSLTDNTAGAGYHIPHTAITEATDVSLPLGNQMEVYDAELFAITESAKHILRIAKTRQLRNKSAWIFSDNQSAITRLSSLKPGPGQSSSIAISHTAQELKTRQISLSIQWAPGHKDIPGNERADKLAKHATTLRQPPYPPTSLAHIKKQAKATMTREWHDYWTAKTQPAKDTQDRSDSNRTRSWPPTSDS
jgi:ribonuclease HI